MNDRASRPDDERQTPSDGIERITAATAQDFRNWLSLHHTTARAVWLVYFKKHSATPSITWTEAVDEALCFGWIDSTARTLDADRYEQYFTRRRPNSPWSRVNKDKIDALHRAGTQPNPPSAEPAREPATELGDPRRRRLPAPLRHARPGVLRPQDRRGQTTTIRALKRRLSDVIYRHLVADAHRREQQ